MPKKIKQSFRQHEVIEEKRKIREQEKERSKKLQEMLNELREEKKAKMNKYKPSNMDITYVPWTLKTLEETLYFYVFDSGDTEFVCHIKKMNNDYIHFFLANVSNQEAIYKGQIKNNREMECLESPSSQSFFNLVEDSLKWISSNQKNEFRERMSDYVNLIKNKKVLNICEDCLTSLFDKPTGQIKDDIKNTLSEIESIKDFKLTFGIEQLVQEVATIPNNLDKFKDINNTIDRIKESLEIKLNTFIGLSGLD